MGTRTELARSPVFEPDGTGGYTVRSARRGGGLPPGRAPGRAPGAPSASLPSGSNARRPLLARESGAPLPLGHRAAAAPAAEAPALLIRIRA